MKHAPLGEIKTQKIVLKVQSILDLFKSLSKKLTVKAPKFSFNIGLNRNSVAIDYLPLVADA